MQIFGQLWIWPSVAVTWKLITAETTTEVKNRTDAEKSQFACLEKAELPPSFWEKPCIIKIDTYFQDFPNPLTQLKQLLFLNPTTVWHCLRQTDHNQFPHLYNSFDLAEKRSPHVSAVCCFLLWQFSFIWIQPAFNAFIVHCLNLPKGQNTNSVHKCHTTIRLGISDYFCFYIWIWPCHLFSEG